MYYIGGREVRQRGRPRKTWKKVDGKDMTALRIKPSDAINGIKLWEMITGNWSDSNSDGLS